MESLKCYEGVFLEAELGHVQLEIGLVQEPQDDLFAEEGRQDRDAEIHLASLAELQLDTAVLGQTPLGDVQLGHDLHAGSDGVLDLEGKAHGLAQHAVHPVSDSETSSRTARYGCR